METKTKIAVGVMVVGLLTTLKSGVDSIIRIISTDAATDGVQYYMQYGSCNITDTFFLGDSPNAVPCSDGKHFFLAFGNVATKIVTLAIGYYDSTGAFKSIKEHIISF